MIRLENNHPTLSLVPKVKEIAHPFLESHGLNYFQYLRCYSDGGISLLITDPGLFLRFTNLDSPLVFSAFKEEHLKKQSYWFLWDQELPHEPVKLAREYYNWHHGLTLVKRTQNYYDMIAIATPEERLNVASYYMNKLPIIEQFMADFLNYEPDLSQVMHNNPIALPEENRDVNYQQLCLKGDQRLPFGNAYITTQELKCLNLRLQGYSYKEIGKICQLSPRTVETYLTRVKSRSGIDNKFQLKELVTLCR